MSAASFDPHPFLTLQIQSVIYNHPPDALERAAAFIESAALQAQRHGIIREVRLSYGDCSPQPRLGNAVLTGLKERYPGLAEIRYTHFGGNLGSAEGHNRLMQTTSTDLLIIMNPDVLPSPNLFVELCKALATPQVGLVEARQLPIEHQKDYDPVTGETSWASTACAMGATTLFHELGGFDSKTFFLYCDDVDFSWRVRLAGYRIVHCSTAVVYHDKRLDRDGRRISTLPEEYYSAEAALLLSYKYSRPDITERYLRHFRSSGLPTLEKAATSFELRQKAGRLPTPIDPDHTVGQFVNNAYAAHRF